MHCFYLIDRCGYGNSVMIYLVSYDDRNIEYVEMTCELNANRCRNLGYHFEFHRDFAPNLPPWWVKVFLINEYLRRSPVTSENWFVWLDSDAVLTDGPVALDRFLNTMPDSCHFVGSYDYLFRPGSMNAGVFAVRDSRQGRAIMQSWCHFYDPVRWRFKSGCWHTDGLWAGSTFEQGVFNDRVMADTTLRSAIRICGNDFVSYEFDSAGCIKHFPVELRPMVKAYCQLSKVSADNLLCVRFGGEYHELGQIDDNGLHLVRWPLRFPVSTALKIDGEPGDSGCWEWRHDGLIANGTLQLFQDGTVNSSWFGTDGWWSRSGSWPASPLAKVDARTCIA